MAWPVLGERHLQNASGRGSIAPAEQPRIVPVWPVLGAKRALAVEHAERLAERLAEQPAKKQKLQTRQEHDNLKFDTVFRGKGLPQEVEALVMGYATLPLQHQLFEKKYGKQLAVYTGDIPVSGWHPKIRSTTRERYGWCVFEKPDNRRFPWFTSTPPVKQCTQASMQPLVGKEVLVRYQNKAGKVTIMDPKTVDEVFHDRMTIREQSYGPNSSRPSPFTIWYTGIQSVVLFVDMKLHEDTFGRVYSMSKQRFIY